MPLQIRQITCFLMKEAPVNGIQWWVIHTLQPSAVLRVTLINPGSNCLLDTASDRPLLVYGSRTYVLHVYNIIYIHFNTVVSIIYNAIYNQII